MDSQAAYAHAFDTSVKLISMLGQFYIAWFVASIVLPGELFTGRQSLRAQRAMEAIQESANGEHKVITVAFGRG